MRLVSVVLLFQVSEEHPLKSVDVLYVAEDGLQLRLSEHFRVFPALTNVTLKTSMNKVQILAVGAGRLIESITDTLANSKHSLT